MFKFIRNAYQYHQRYLLLRGRRVAREILLDKSDRELEDLGFSRFLLSAGISQWPWRLEDEHKCNSINPKVEADAISALQSMSDRELFDLGITRGTIEESVRHGRAGINSTPTDKHTIREALSVDHKVALVQKPVSTRVLKDDRNVA